jgi:hypothetical protein
MTVDKAIESTRQILKIMAGRISPYDRIIPYRNAKSIHSRALADAFESLLQPSPSATLFLQQSDPDLCRT